MLIIFYPRHISRRIAESRVLILFGRIYYNMSYHEQIDASINSL